MDKVVSALIDDDIRIEAIKILSKKGLDIPETIRLCYLAIIKHQKVPFEISDVKPNHPVSRNYKVDTEIYEKANNILCENNISNMQMIRALLYNIVEKQDVPFDIRQLKYIN